MRVAYVCCHRSDERGYVALVATRPVRTGARVRLVVGSVLLAVTAACSGGGSHHATAPTTTTALPSRPVVAVHVPVCPVLPDANTRSWDGDANGRLVPVAAVGVRVCRYGFDSGTELLAGSGLVTDARTVAGIEDATNTLPAVSTAVADACQGGPVAAVLVLFSDASRTVAVREDSMCGITNGVVWARPTASWNNTIGRVGRQTAERPAIPLPTLPPTQQRLQALAFVTLQSDGRCIWFPAFGARTVVLWPHGYTAPSWPLRVLDDHGHVVARVGIKTQLGGGYVPMTRSLLARVQPPETRACFTIGKNAWVL